MDIIKEGKGFLGEGPKAQLERGEVNSRPGFDFCDGKRTTIGIKKKKGLPGGPAVDGKGKPEGLH